MNGTKDTAEKLMDFLALNRYAEGLRSLQVPKDALNWTRFCGSLSLVLVVLLFLSGAFMMFYYRPLQARPMTAWTLLSSPSLSRRSQGRALLCLEPSPCHPGASPGRDFPHSGLQGSQTDGLGLGVLIFLVVPAFIVTGDLLPWDQKGYWTTQVRNSIISSVPCLVISPCALLQGGPRTGIVALTDSTFSTRCSCPVC